MIARALQMANYGDQSISQGEVIKFNQIIQAWPLSGFDPPPITYSGGRFSIQSPKLSDYLVSWSVSIKTATVTDTLPNVYIMLVEVSQGTSTEGSFSSLDTTTGIMNGYKIIHASDKNPPYPCGTLYFTLTNRSSYSTSYLTTPSSPLPNGIDPILISNANICIFSI